MSNPHQHGTPEWHQESAAHAVRGAHQQQYDSTGYGGLGYDPVSGKTYVSVNRSSTADAVAELTGKGSVTYCTTHQGFVALAVGSNGSYALEAWSSAWVAMHRAIDATGDPQAKIIALMSTWQGTLDIDSAWQQGAIAAQRRGAVVHELGRAGRGFVVVAICVIILGIGGFSPSAGLVLLLLVGAWLLLRRSQRRGRQRRP